MAGIMSLKGTRTYHDIRRTQEFGFQLSSCCWIPLLRPDQYDADGSSCLEDVIERPQYGAIGSHGSWRIASGDD